MKYVSVVIDNNSDHTDRLYTYYSGYDKISVGSKVYVPFSKGNRIKPGYVFEVFDELEKPIKNLKFVERVDEDIFLSAEAVKTCRWMRKRYLCRYIEAVKCFIPAGAPSKKGKLRNPFKEAVFEESDPKILTDEQIIALNMIREQIALRSHKTFLLHGVTSSGKTEVYMQAIAEVIKNGKQAIMLVPEISLTGQTIERFMGRFGAENIAVLHSKLTLGERYDEWMRVKRGEVNILIGARSGVFAPFDNIGIIILDEEHETTYKSDMNPKYDAVEVAVKRGENANAVVLLGSATPSLTSGYRCETGDYKLITLKERHNKAPMPKVEILDMRAELRNGNKSIFSVALYDKIKKTLEEKKQVILFLNRRGYSTFVSCRSCGYVMKCEECGISLTYHKAINKAVCHICGRSLDVPKTCPKCDSKYLKHFGTGTEKVEEFTKELFPESTVARLDFDTSKKKGSIEKILNAFKKNKTNILIGTQLVAKGLDFANVGLVGIISADISLNIPNYQAAERTFQLITQAAGRTGRGEEAGDVIIQTYSPEHYAIIAASKHDYEEFYNLEIKVRRALLYPPFSDLLQVTVMSENKEDAERISTLLVTTFIENTGAGSKKYVFGPQPTYVSKANGQYRYEIIIKVLPAARKEYFTVLNHIKLNINGVKNPTCFVSVDIN